MCKPIITHFSLYVKSFTQFFIIISNILAKRGIFCVKRLKDLREDHDLKQSDIAKILHISQQYYQCYESGKNELPLRHAITLAKYYNISLDYIAGLSTIPRTLENKYNPTMEKYYNLLNKLETADSKIKKAIEILLDE